MARSHAGVPRQFRVLVRVATAAGWRCQRTGSGHLALYPPDQTVDPVYLAGSPSDHRAWRNVRALLRRRGLKVA